MLRFHFVSKTSFIFSFFIAPEIIGCYLPNQVTSALCMLMAETERVLDILVIFSLKITVLFGFQ